MKLEERPKSSPAKLLASLPDSERNKRLGKLSLAEKAALRYHWPFWARDNQLPPEGEWQIWILLGGRGFGKTRSGAEWARSQAERYPGSRGALVAPTPADARDVMIEGESGLLNICPPDSRPIYEPSKRRLEWRNGSVATVYSAHEPLHLRGPQHHWAWCDELASWKKLPRHARPDNLEKDNPWHMLMMGLRLGDNPRCVVTTTPKPIPLIKELLEDDSVRVTRGATYDNSENLAQSFLEQILKKYEGTNLGKQELYAAILDEVEGALWTRDLIDRNRVRDVPELVRVVVGVDPSGGVAETGIVCAGLGDDEHVYILADASLKASPLKWASEAILTLDQYKGDRIVAEKNFGGDMVESNIMTASEHLNVDAPYKGVTASRGKQVRAEPVAALYEQGRVHHVGVFDALESEMTTWVPGEESPNRLDAMVWAVTELRELVQPFVYAFA